jgi:AcrR family transcriptional regulator
MSSSNLRFEIKRMLSTTPSTANRRARASGSKRSGRPPDTDGEVTRRKIMDSAQLCFAEQGYRETSNRIIADKAGVTPGTIYHYFKNKRDLFMTVHEEIQEEVQKRVRTAVESAPTFREALRTFIDRSLDLYKEHPNYSKFNAVVRTEALRNPEIAGARFDQDWRHFYHDLTDRGIASGEIDRHDARAVRHVLSMIVLGLTQHGIEASAADHAECLRGVICLFEGSLIKQPNSATRKR